MSNSEAYEEGYRVGSWISARPTRDDNPYPDGEEWLEWDRGFTDGYADVNEAYEESRADARRDELMTKENDNGI